MRCARSGVCTPRRQRSRCRPGPSVQQPGEALPDRGGGLVRGRVPDVLVEDLDLHESGVPRGQQPRSSPARSRSRRRRDGRGRAGYPPGSGPSSRTTGRWPCGRGPARPARPAAGPTRRGSCPPPRPPSRPGTAGPGRARRPAGTRHTRSAQNIGCMGSMPSRTPSRCAVGTRSAIASATMRRARVRSRLPDGRPPETRTRVSAPSSAASAMARRLSARALARAGPSGWVKKPPRQRLDTCRPAARTSGRCPAQAGLGHPVAPQPDGGNLVPDAQVHALRQVQVLHRGLIKGQPVAAQRARAHGLPSAAR